MADETTDVDETTDDTATTDTETEGSEKGHEDSRWDDAPDDDAEIEEWKQYARRWEKRAKQSNSDRKTKAAERRATQAEKKLTELENASKSDQEKALEKVKADAKAEAQTEAQTEIRKERLTAAFARAAAGKVADIDDAFKLLDVEHDDLFDEDGKVDKDALQSAIEDLLDRKKYLAADPSRPTGDADAGKGKGGGKSLEDMSVEEHFQRIRRNK